MSVLSGEQKCAVISALTEGVSIRATERLTGIHRDTIMRLGAKVGEGCAAVHDRLMVNLQVGRIELDEVWSFVKKKKSKVTADEDGETVGDQFIYLAMDSTGKAILSWLVGKRSTRNTITFVGDVRRRVIGNPEISTDGYAPYVRAVDEAFQGTAHHGIVDKQEVFVAKGPNGTHGAKSVLAKVQRTVISGSPATISTSHIERQNLTLRMSQRRLTRLTNGFSKKYENHCAAIALYAGHYNFCRIHEALRITPAMQLGITDHIWSVSELIAAALTGEIQEKAPAYRGLRLIQGGKI